MYTLPNKLKVFALVFMVVGAIGIVAGFLSTPKTLEEVEAIMAEANHDGGHATNDHDTAAPEMHQAVAHEASQEMDHSGHQIAQEGHQMVASDHMDQDAHQEHMEHVMQQMQNRPWSALYIASFFFFMIALGALAFYAIQYAAQAGW